MNTNVRMAVVALLTATATTTLPGIASQVNALITFTANSPARASEVNGNFTAVKTAVDDNQAQIIALRTELAELKAKLTNVTAVNDYLSLQTVNGQPTVRVSAANFQVVNGTGETSTNNGTGNVIVGYDESTTFTSKSGSHNLVVGIAQTYTSYGGVVFGDNNYISAPFASVTGGIFNSASGELSVISGGGNGQAAGRASVISGGYLNQATARGSVVSGGYNNIADDNDAIVSGGANRFTNAEREWVGGPYRGE